MHSNRNKINILISREVFLYVPLLLLVIPLRFLLSFMVAAAVHEMFHIAAICMLKIPINSFQIGIHGMVIETHSMSMKQEFLCAAAGPLGGLALLLFLRKIPLIAVIGIIQSLYNLLPMYPTDGGRILKCVMNMAFSEKTADKLVNNIEILIQSAIVGCCIFATVWLSLGILPMVFGATVLRKWLIRK